MEDLLGGGIKISQINNYNMYKDVIANMICCVCLHVVCRPVECKLCETVICEDCQQIILIAGKKCVTHNCNGDFRKANKFVREMLSNLVINCEFCGKKQILYKDHATHLENCDGYLSSVRHQLFRSVREKDDKVIELQKNLLKEVEALNKSKNTVKYTDPYLQLNKEALRKALMTFNLSVGDKMELYNSCVEGRLNDFKHLVQVKKFNVLEEVSAHSYYWTPLHYAMHYGQWDLIKFICDHLKNSNQFDGAMRLESNDNRCPLLCLLRSNNLTLDKKKDFLTKFLTSYPTTVISPDVKKEIKARDLESIVKKYSKTYI